MQTNFKIISSYEYDVSSGVYKQVNKEVEDFSSSDQQSFMDMLSNESDQKQQTSLETQNEIPPEKNSTISSYALNSNLYSYRFRQNESLQMQSQSSNQNEQNTQNKVLNELLGMI